MYSRRIDALSVASFNLHCGADARGAPYDVVEAIERLDASVVCLQVVCLQEDFVPKSSSGEPPGPDRVAQAADRLGASLYRAPMWESVTRSVLGIPAHGGRGDLCISVLTPLPVIAYDVVPLGHGPGDSVPRYAQVLQIRTPDGPVRLVNTHLSVSVASPLQLWRLWRQFRGDAVPTAIAGDLNMPALLARRYTGLTDVVRGPTFPAEQPFVQLDHVLVSRGVDGQGSGVLPPAGSDHRPIWASLRLDGRT